MKKYTLLLLITIFLLPINGVFAKEEPLNLTLVAGGIGGGWFTQASVISEAIKKGLPEGSAITVVPGGGISNVHFLSMGKADIGYAQTCWAGWTESGGGPLRNPAPNIRGIAMTQTNFIAFLVRKDTGISSIGEIKDKKMKFRLATRKPSSDGGGAMARIFLAEYGWGSTDDAKPFEELINWGGEFKLVHSHGEAVDLIKDGHVDGWILNATPRHPQIIQLTKMRDMAFLSIDDDVLASLEKNFGIRKVVIPKGTFPDLDEDLVTIEVPVGLATHKDVPDEVVYKFLKALDEYRDDIVAGSKAFKGFKPETAWQGTGYKLHPGAVKYYKEKGYMK